MARFFAPVVPRPEPARCDNTVPASFGRVLDAAERAAPTEPWTLDEPLCWPALKEDEP